jgi:hypothetical protein
VLECDWPGKSNASGFAEYLNTQVHFHNTMVDRITAHRAGDTIVPLAEPLPSKALVIEDLHQVLDSKLLTSFYGTKIRTQPKEIQKDHLLKLCIANGIHTSMVYLMALCRLKNTKDCLQHTIILEYLDQLFEADILPGLVKRGIEKQFAVEVYEEWIERLKHPHFGIDTFFVSQNAISKYGIRVFSSIVSNLYCGARNNDDGYKPSPFMAFSTAVLLRYLTPVQPGFEATSRGNVFVGQLDSIKEHAPLYNLKDEKTWTYVSGLTANIATGIYQFRDGFEGQVPQLLYSISKNIFSTCHHHNSDLNGHQLPNAENAAIVGVGIASILGNHVREFDLKNPILVSFAAQVAALYQRLICGEQNAMSVLLDVLRNHTTSAFLGSYEEIDAYVRETVASVKIIDVHTHLFPPSHGKLMLWGINELLTYHYLVAEFLQTAPMEVEEFNTFSKEKQAELIWNHLFIQRSPISEACRGVITTLQALGLTHLVEKRDLKSIQAWFAQQDPEEYVDTVFRLAGLKYAVMTNIPFEPEEARHWLGDPKTNTPPPVWSRKHFRSALRIDQILLGDWKTIKPTLDLFGLPATLEGCRTLLIKWIDIMQPEYFMSSVPIDFQNLPEKDQRHVAIPTGQLPTGADLLLKVLLPLAEEKKLPIALKFDSVRPINARLGVAGDGVKASDVRILQNLCRNFPKVKFLATFLSRVNQHEVTVTANKFRNLHLYGCWWYCNNPSIIDEMTRMRIEILGTAFTSQHSDARVLDQLIYKWRHSREIIGKILVEMYVNLAKTGWKLSKQEIKRDIERLFGTSYEEFMAKT